MTVLHDIDDGGDHDNVCIISPPPRPHSKKQCGTSAQNPLHLCKFLNLCSFACGSASSFPSRIYGLCTGFRKMVTVFSKTYRIACIKAMVQVEVRRQKHTTDGPCIKDIFTRIEAFFPYQDARSASAFPECFRSCRVSRVSRAQENGVA